ncbi:MAG: mercury methylation corrinoid protein HgcA [Nitrospiraceae bacterium]|nr:mercury methylation corrinoid protein HgcA [Nitrospiraceae bacterium]
MSGTKKPDFKLAGPVKGPSCACNGPGGTGLKNCCTAGKQKPPYVTGTVRSAIGEVWRVSTGLTPSDKWGIVKCRTSSYRNDYKVEAGLYAAGQPGRGSDVLVTANYKYSFDVLRRELKGISAWILVLDTNGINVWCAAGKGTFGTAELVKRISLAQLDKLVEHKRIIVPQLGAAGVSAHEVKKATGYRVVYGPVNAKDIPAFIEAEYKATREMRTMGFPVKHRLVLTPMEIVPMLKKYPLFALVILLAFGLQPSGILFRSAFQGGLPFLLFGLVSIFAGAFLTPVLLPYIPSRAFAVKGWIMGAVTTGLSLVIFPRFNPILLSMILLFFPLASSYIALQFTGSTTFTGMSGVKKELKTGIPLYLISTAVSAVLLVIYKLIEWRMI